jgi:signal transduction histidine kinase
MLIKDDALRPYLLAGTVMDITERKVASQDQQFLRSAAESLRGAKSFEDVLETLNQLASSYFCDGCFSDTNLISPGPDSQIAQGEGAFSWRLTVELKGSPYPFSKVCFFTLVKSSKMFHSRHIRLAEELCASASRAMENLQMRLQSQEALQSRDEILAITSHELKTPMQSLILQNQMRLRQIQKNPPHDDSSQRMEKLIEADLRHLFRMNRLINDILDLSSLREGKLSLIKQRAKFWEFIHEVIGRFQPQIDAAGCRISIQGDQDATGDFDHYRIEQVLVNILSNAIKYGPGLPILLRVIKNNPWVEIRIYDQGPGLSQEHLERVFEQLPRKSTGEQRAGLGICLFISKKIVQQHKGNLYAENNPDKGSVFIIQLPCEKSSEGHVISQ